MQQSQLFPVRKRFGGTYITIFNDDLVVPWKLLSIQDYIQYDSDVKRGLIPLSHLENEIFKKCVLDDSLLRQFDSLKAGVIATVVQHIWEYSGPTGIDSFNQDIENARVSLSSDGSKVLHQCAQLISTAFPYKPEEIYGMDYPTFLLRLAQAESKLIQAGMLKEPIRIEQPGLTKERKGPRPSDPNNRVDAKRIWEDQQFKKDSSKKSPGQGKRGKDKWWKVSPVLESSDSHQINFREESAEQHVFGATGHEKADIHITSDKMVKDAQWIYKDLLAGLAKKKKHG